MLAPFASEPDADEEGMGVTSLSIHRLPRFTDSGMLVPNTCLTASCTCYPARQTSTVPMAEGNWPVMPLSIHSGASLNPTDVGMLK